MITSARCFGDPAHPRWASLCIKPSGLKSARSPPIAARATTLATFRAGMLPRLGTAEEGSVAVVSAVSITVLMYAAAIALDLTNLYYTKSVDQRIADQAAVTAAFTYASTGSTATAQNAASSLALANGVGSALYVTTAIVTSPTGDGRQAVEVTILTPVQLTGVGRMITSTKTSPQGNASQSVGATAYGEIHESAPCILGLASPGIAMTGGTTIAATACSVASNSTISLSSGPTLSASTIYAVGSITSSNSTINGAQYPNSSATVDPYANSLVFSREATVLSEAAAAPAFPSMPSAPNTPAYTTCSSGTLSLAAGTGYGYVIGSGTCTINFSGSGTFTLLGLEVSGGTVMINMPAGTYKIGDSNGTGIGFTGGTGILNITGDPTMYLYGPIAGLSGSSGTFSGSANWNISGGILFYGSGTFTMSNSGSTTSNFTTAAIVVGSGATATFPSGSYTITGSSQYGGLVVNGTSATFGKGSFIVEDGIVVGSSSRLTIGSALSGSSVFEVFASTEGTSCSGTAVSTGGSSMLSIGSFTNIDVCGQWITDGSVTLGAGNATIYGEFDLGSGGGGTFSAISNSIVANGPVTFGQGFSAILLDAPAAITTSSEGGTPTVALASSTGSASTVTQGATNSDIVGLLYLPNAALTINGGGNLTGGGNCLQLIANSISMSGGGSVTTNCTSLGTGAASGAVSLVE